MTLFFSQKKDQNKKIETIFHKKHQFQVEIRKKSRQNKKKHLRDLYFGIGPHIKPMVDALPNSFSDIMACLSQNPQYHHVISKLVVDRIYQTEIRLDQQAFQWIQNYSWRSFILPQKQEFNNKQGLKRKLYFLIILLENQGSIAPYIFEKYFPILKNQAEKFNETLLLFDLIKIIVKQKKLNWVPIQQLQQTIELIQSSGMSQISQQQAQVYIHLCHNYYEIVNNNLRIRRRIVRLLEQGSRCFQFIKPKLFFKICLALTYHQNSQKNSNGEEFQEGKNKQYFHAAMLKGSIIKNLFRQIFYSSKDKLRRLCLKVMSNLIIQLSSKFIWMEQKFDHINNFQIEIRNTVNSMQTFQVFCETFLLSLVYIPLSNIQVIFEKEVDVMGLILQILQNNQLGSQKGLIIKKLAEESLWIILEYGNQQIRYQVSNKLMQSSWLKFFQQDSDIILQCQKYLQSCS